MTALQLSYVVLGIIGAVDVYLLFRLYQLKHAIQRRITGYMWLRKQLDEIRPVVEKQRDILAALLAQQAKKQAEQRNAKQSEKKKDKPFLTPLRVALWTGRIALWAFGVPA